MEKPPAYIQGPGSPPQYPPPPSMYPQVPVNYQPQAAGLQTFILPVQYGDQPVPTTCPNCNQRVVTELSYEAGGLTYLAAFGIALFFWCGCCLIPCCLDSCKDVYHRCPECRVQLGIHKRL
ncbi:lipopolysaccharide-induced tumor necrosis factor-alpha factor homolog [Galendromus occidentalis]|uniref:Lipopolysaccharide-induced tumor necrosis factor-alpha factor homolog n=1 Tax=Galendromus occidentalis TaxID=34638 RepID=A0AAJ7SHL0_9ACAR|nr:lipopolysaccharide-induced tumor necrosis factor-alpha factor homolog [Galendromus occidentalis]